jgi:hypothetical protein
MSIVLLHSTDTDEVWYELISLPSIPHQTHYAFGEMRAKPFNNELGFIPEVV